MILIPLGIITRISPSRNSGAEVQEMLGRGSPVALHESTTVFLLMFKTFIVPEGGCSVIYAGRK